MSRIRISIPEGVPTLEISGVPKSVEFLGVKFPIPSRIADSNSPTGCSMFSRPEFTDLMFSTVLSEEERRNICVVAVTEFGNRMTIVGCETETDVIVRELAEEEDSKSNEQNKKRKASVENSEESPAKKPCAVDKKLRST